MKNQVITATEARERFTGNHTYEKLQAGTYGLIARECEFNSSARRFVTKYPEEAVKTIMDELVNNGFVVRMETEGDSKFLIISW